MSRRIEAIARVELIRHGASHETMRVVYVAHPLGAGPDRERNRANASAWCGRLGRELKVCCVADWITLSGQWDEETGRELGLRCDLALIARCDEIWLTGGRVSPGMALELAEARRLGKLVRDFTPLGYDVPDALWLPEASPIGWAEGMKAR